MLTEFTSSQEICTFNDWTFKSKIGFKRKVLANTKISVIDKLILWNKLEEAIGRRTGINNKLISRYKIRRKNKKLNQLKKIKKLNFVKISIYKENMKMSEEAFQFINKCSSTKKLPDISNTRNHIAKSINCNTIHRSQRSVFSSQYLYPK